MGKSEIAEIAEIATSRDINLKKRYFQRNNFEGIVHRNLFLVIHFLEISENQKINTIQYEFN